MSASLQEGNVGATAACDFARVKFSSAQLRISLPSIFTYLYIVLYHNIQIVQYRMMRLILFSPRPKSSAPHPLTKRSRPYIIGIASHASVAELVDAQDLGSCALCMGVRVPSLAPKKALWISQCFFIGSHLFR